MNHRRALAVFIAIAWAAACSTYGGEEASTPAPERDGGSDASVPIDAATTDVEVNGDGGAVKCDRAKPFGLPLAVPGLATNEYEASARLTADELDVFWARYDNVSWSLWTATRQKSDAPFDNAIKLAIVNDLDAGRDFDPSASGDGLTLYFTSERLGGADIFVSSRGSRSAAFALPKKVDEASGSADDRRPFIAPDGQSLWFDSARSGVSRIYRMTISPVGNGNPEMIDLGGSASMNDEYPVLSADGLALYFSGRGRDGSEGHVYMATRATTGDPFGSPVRVDKWLGFSAPTWITADECRLYVTVGGQGAEGTRLAMVQRSK